MTNTVVSNNKESSNPDISVRATTAAGVITPGVTQHINLDNTKEYTIRMDEGATYTYIGKAEIASLTSSAVWLIKRLTLSDNTILFADG